jgi:hypothetical protein
MGKAGVEMSDRANSRFRFSLKLLLFIVSLAAAFLAGYRLGYGVAETKVIVELVNDGWVPPKPTR